MSTKTLISYGPFSPDPQERPDAYLHLDIGLSTHSASLFLLLTLTEKSTNVVPKLLS